MGVNDYIYDMANNNSPSSSSEYDATISSMGKRKIIKKSYEEILEEIRKTISTNHAEQLRDVIDSPESQKVLRNLISKYINQKSFKCTDSSLTFDKLVDKIFQDMAEFGILTDYIRDPDVEEININSYRDIEVLYPQEKGGFRKLEEHFTSAQQAVDIVQRMMQLGGIRVDESQPVKDSYLTKGIRCSAIINPCVDKEVGVAASIRKQKPSAITREKLIRDNSATAAELDLINACIRYGVSVNFTGGTGSGKTADMGVALRSVPYNKRIYTIEDSRELNLVAEEGGKIVNRIIHTVTRPHEDVKSNIDADLLLKQALRQDPDIIVPAEMRGGEAWTAVNAGTTGHTVVTSVHANSAEDAYERIFMLCQEQNANMTEQMLMKQIIKAFPITVFKKQLPDGSRRVMSIVEASDYRNGKVLYNTIFRFQRTGEDDKQGHKNIIGVHKKVGCISDKLALRMYENDADIEFIQRYAHPNWNPDEAYDKIEKEAAGSAI